MTTVDKIEIFFRIFFFSKLHCRHQYQPATLNVAPQKYGFHNMNNVNSDFIAERCGCIFFPPGRKHMAVRFQCRVCSALKRAERQSIEGAFSDATVRNLRATSIPRCTYIHIMLLTILYSRYV